MVQIVIIWISNLLGAKKMIFPSLFCLYLIFFASNCGDNICNNIFFLQIIIIIEYRNYILIIPALRNNKVQIQCFHDKAIRDLVLSIGSILRCSLKERLHLYLSNWMFLWCMIDYYKIEFDDRFFQFDTQVTILNSRIWKSKIIVVSLNCLRNTYQNYSY
jgi:hypothetical protein